MRQRLHTTVHLLRHFGLGWLMFRLRYALRKRAGTLRRLLPATAWQDQPLASFLDDRRLAEPEQYARRRGDDPRPFFFHCDDAGRFQSHFSKWDAVAGGPQTIADALADGRFRFFEQLEINLGVPPNWHRNPVTGEESPRDRHWTEIGDFSGGDVKLVWEPSRFAWVYPLVRAYWRTGDELYPRLFWELFADWQQANPPQRGVHWKCGQEVALRMMACCFGMYGFAASPESTPSRLAALAQVMGVSANRIEGNLSYALSQQNNHGITEATGLWTVGLLFPEFRASDRWLRLGRDALERQIAALIDDDGAFSQHSVNYQRVMLDACLWAIRLGELHERPLSSGCIERVIRAGEFLWRIQDETSGQVPRYGQNDGALVLPLTNCNAADYRPVIQLAAALEGQRRYELGPWDEGAVWMFGPEALNMTPDTTDRTDWYGRAGGYQVLRADSGHVMTRAPRYRHRPAHADALHVDLWWRGRNIALDAGTYSYNAAPPWNNPLAGTPSHNTVSVDGRDQMDRAGRFLWLPWLSGKRTAYAASPSGQLAYWEGTHDGYRRLSSSVTHRRGILRIGGEHWLVIDALHSRAPHTYRLHWLLHDAPYLIDEVRRCVSLQTDLGDYHVQSACVRAESEFSLVRADAESPRGWYAPCYHDRQPALSLALETNAASVTFATLFGPADCDLQVEETTLSVSYRNVKCQASLLDAGADGEPILECVELRGSLSESLSVSAGKHLGE